MGINKGGAEYCIMLSYRWTLFWSRQLTNSSITFSVFSKLYFCERKKRKNVRSVGYKTVHTRGVVAIQSYIVVCRKGRDRTVIVGVSPCAFVSRKRLGLGHNFCQDSRGLFFRWNCRCLFLFAKEPRHRATARRNSTAGRLILFSKKKSSRRQLIEIPVRRGRWRPRRRTLFPSPPRAQVFRCRCRPKSKNYKCA